MATLNEVAVTIYTVKGGKWQEVKTIVDSANKRHDAPLCHSVAGQHALRLKQHCC